MNFNTRADADVADAEAEAEVRPVAVMVLMSPVVAHPASDVCVFGVLVDVSDDPASRLVAVVLAVRLWPSLLKIISLLTSSWS